MAFAHHGCAPSLAAVRAGADVNAANEAGDTALHAAAAAGLDRVVSRLAAMGANVNARNVRGQTPLAMVTARQGQAGAAGRSTTADLLRSLGAAE